MHEISVGSICAGIDGLGLGLEATGYFRVVWHSEIEPEPSAILAERFGVPNIGDITTVDYSKVRRVGLLCAGYPCQPFSYAGKRKGKNDKRHLWPFVFTAVKTLRPRWVLFENVSGHISLGLREVLADLRSAGYTTLRPVLVEAACFGATHHRERIIILAYCDSDGLPGEFSQKASEGCDDEQINLIEPTSVLADSTSERCGETREFRRDESTQRSSRNGEVVVNAECGDDETLREVGTINVSGREAASGQHRAGCSSIVPNVWADWHAQPRLGRSTHGFPYRLDATHWPLPPGLRQWEWEPPRIAPREEDWSARIKALGNAVVPSVGAYIGWLILEMEKARVV